MAGPVASNSKFPPLSIDIPSTEEEEEYDEEEEKEEEKEEEIVY